MYQIKQIPEDFVVKEIFNVKAFSDKGTYVYFKLKKKEWNTIDAIKFISRKLGIPEKEVGFAGSKDKNAITEQMISIKNVRKERIDKLELKLTEQKDTESRSLELEFIGYGNQPICLGDLQGNYFEIVIRNLDLNVLKEKAKIVNYFDEQRFGRNNIKVGRNIIKKNFKEAVRLIENERLNNHLKQKENDFIGALKLLPDRILKLYVHAYQSYIWNETIKEVLKNTMNIESIPLIGFGTNLNKYGSVTKKIIEKIMLREEITQTDLIVKQIPNLSLEGDERRVFVEIQDFKVLEKGNDELNKNKKKVKVSFSLPKGSYATRVVKEMFE